MEEISYFVPGDGIRIGEEPVGRGLVHELGHQDYGG